MARARNSGGFWGWAVALLSFALVVSLLFVYLFYEQKDRMVADLAAAKKLEFYQGDIKWGVKTDENLPQFTEVRNLAEREGYTLTQAAMKIIERRDSTINKLESDVANKQAEVGSLTAANLDLEEQRQGIVGRITAAEKATEEAVEAAAEEKTTLTQQITALQAETDSLQIARDDVEKRLNDKLINQNATSEEEIDDLRKQLIGLEADIADRAATIAQLEEDIIRHNPVIQTTPADGLVREVMTKEVGTEMQEQVYLSLGTQDNLLAGQDFEVFDPGHGDQPRYRRQGSRQSDGGSDTCGRASGTGACGAQG